MWVSCNISLPGWVQVSHPQLLPRFFGIHQCKPQEGLKEISTVLLNKRRKPKLKDHMDFARPHGQSQFSVIIF